MTVSAVFEDQRNTSQPYCVTLRRGEFVEFHRFASPADAEAFREEWC